MHRGTPLFWLSVVSQHGFGIISIPYGSLLKGGHHHHSSLEMMVYKTIHSKAKGPKTIRSLEQTDKKSDQQSISLGWRCISLKMNWDFILLFCTTSQQCPSPNDAEGRKSGQSNPLLPAHIFRLYVQLITKGKACTRAPLPPERNQSLQLTSHHTTWLHMKAAHNFPL